MLKTKYQKVFFLILFWISFCDAQTFDLIIKNGHVIDPKNNLDSKLDIGITDGIIKKISNKNLSLKLKKNN